VAQEVYTISGAFDYPAFGEIPGNLRQLDQQMQAQAASPAVRLQNALKALGVTANDALLKAIKVDGAIGPATVAGVNHALAHYVGATPAFQNANLTLPRVKSNAAALAGLIEFRVQKSGGSVPAPVIERPAARTRRAFAPIVTPDVTPTPSFPRWGWYVVAGVSGLVVLAAFASAVKKKRATA